MQIEGTKLIFVMNFSVLDFFKICLQNASDCSFDFRNIQGRLGVGGGGGGACPQSPPRNFLFFFFLFFFSVDDTSLCNDFRYLYFW